MKMFKKLMAIALAGVMALAILTGCANYKNMVQMMNDASERYGYGLTVKEDYELTKKAKTLAEKIEAEGKDLTAEKAQAIYKEVLGDKYNENYIMVGTDPVSAKNSFAKDYYTMQNAQRLVSGLKSGIPAGKTVNKIGIAVFHDARSDADHLFVLAQLEDKAK